MARYTVSNEIPVALQLAPKDETVSILQNVALILSSAKGTIPFYRAFGVDADYVDRPQTAANVLITRAVTEAIMAFEPRCEVIGADVEWDAENPGRYYVTVEVEI